MRDASAALGLSVGTFRMRLHRGRMLLKRRFLARYAWSQLAESLRSTACRDVERPLAAPAADAGTAAAAPVDRKGSERRTGS